MLLFALQLSCFGANPSPEQLDFFETKVRPVFADHCYSCHSEKAEKVKGDLRLDTPESITRGGSTGPALVPGNPDGSLLIKAVRYTDPDLQMPPKNKKLASEEIGNLEAWVKMGAPMPISASNAPARASIDTVRQKHWAFKPIIKTTPPRVKGTRWVQTPVDQFVLAKLEEKKLKPAPAADRRTLLRRLSYDLTGLPPTFEEVDDFIKDKRPDAYARVVERLLASPHYGERWGRYWLDVARYADTKGYLAGGEERRYAFSYTYRDYVVQAFNDDKPYNQFILEQIAADKLSTGEDKQTLAALGFLTLGRRFLNNQNDIIDDRIDVVTRGTLGLTVACARCHDHKFDPIPSRDYYALHGVFASSEEPGELPLLSPIKQTPEYEDYLKQKAKIEVEIAEFKDKEIAKFMNELRENIGDYLLAARDAAKLEDSGKFDNFAGERKVNPAVLRRWISYLDERKKKPDPIFGPWFELANFPDKDFSTNSCLLVEKLASSGTNVNPLIARALLEETNRTLKAASIVYTRVFKGIDAEYKNLTKALTNDIKNIASAKLPEESHEELRQIMYAEGAPPNVPRSEAESINGRKLREGGAPFRNRIEALSWTHAGAPRRAMALVDRQEPHNSHLLLRGNPNNPGEEVPRRFLEILSSTNRPTFTNGSGRLEMAQAIVSPQNPLTARVFVNRVWSHHFGEGIVRTAGDFGVRTEEPVHRALLDFLATTFMEKGWSIKELQRVIVLSATYQESCDASPGALKADPDNRLLTRMNRQRLDFEAMRDTLLFASGSLDQTVGGLPVDLQSEPFSSRRTLYGFIDRQNLPGFMRTFDFANPDTSSQGRFHTTVPQQALFLMNSPFVIQQARALASRPQVSNSPEVAEKVQALNRLILQRSATPDELQLAEKFITSQNKEAKFGPLEKYAQVLLLSNEAMFID